MINNLDKFFVSTNNHSLMLKIITAALLALEFFTHPCAAVEDTQKNANSGRKLEVS